MSEEQPGLSRRQLLGAGAAGALRATLAGAVRAHQLRRSRGAALLAR